MKRLAAVAFLLAAVTASAQVVTLPPGDYTVHATGTTTFTPAVIPPPTCTGTKPPTTQHNGCTAPLVGPGWDQARTVTCGGTPPAWVVSPWVPATMPTNPSPCTPPVTSLQPLLDQAALLAFAKPARGVSLRTQYGTTESRLTDHAVDRPGTTCGRNDYSRREPFNADNSLVIVYECGGPWLVYNAATHALVKQLNGPGGDSEFQWDNTNPDRFYYVDTNGGMKLYVGSVATNAPRVVLYDMTAQAQALLGLDCTRLWTRSEGSPSDDDVRFGWVCENYNTATGNFDIKGFIVFDVVTKTVLFSKVERVNKVDHVSMTHSGRYLSTSGDTETVYRVADGASCKLRDSGEHSDWVKLPNGHDALATVIFNNTGDIVLIDADQCFADGHATPLVLREHIYNNAHFGTNDVSANHPNGNCGNTSGRGSCSFHISGRAYQKPGWVFFSNYGRKQLSLFAYDVTADAFYGIGVGMTDTAGYFTETQLAVSRDGKSVMFNDTFSNTNDVDDYRIDLP